MNTLSAKAEPAGDILGYLVAAKKHIAVDDSSVLTALPVEESSPARRRQPPVDDTPIEVDEHTTLGLVELLLKQPRRVDRINRDAARQPELIPRFLTIAMISYVVYALTMLLILNFAPASAWPHSFWVKMPPAHWHDGSWAALLIAYPLGLVLVSCICLPTFYFYSLLAGVKMTMRQVVSQVLKGKAAHAVLLLGAIPIYLAIVLGLIVFNASDPVLQMTLKAGLVLPFFVGLWGVRSIYIAVMDLADTLPAEQQCKRTCFLRRMIVAWSLVYSAVAPVLIYRLWGYLAEQFTGTPFNPLM